MPACEARAAGHGVDGESGCLHEFSGVVVSVDHSAAACWAWRGYVHPPWRVEQFAYGVRVSA
jgi:hypothetical protein